MFNSDICLLLKKWVKLNKELIDLLLRIRFLVKYETSNIISKHVNINHLTKLTLYCDKSKRHWTKYIKLFTNIRLNIESDNVKKRYYILPAIYNCTKKIERTLWYIYNKFFCTQSFLLDRYYIRERNRLSSKFSWLTKNRTQYIANPSTNINIFKYFCNTHNQNVRYSFNKPSVTNLLHTIELKPNFNSNSVELLEPKNIGSSISVIILYLMMLLDCYNWAKVFVFLP